MKFESKYKPYHSGKYVSKRRLQNGGYFVHAVIWEQNPLEKHCMEISETDVLYSRKISEIIVLDVTAILDKEEINQSMNNVRLIQLSTIKTKSYQ